MHSNSKWNKKDDGKRRFSNFTGKRYVPDYFEHHFGNENFYDEYYNNYDCDYGVFMIVSIDVMMKLVIV